jgi:hypothetical protein
MRLEGWNVRVFLALLVTAAVVVVAVIVIARGFCAWSRGEVKSAVIAMLRFGREARAPGTRVPGIDIVE